MATFSFTRLPSAGIYVGPAAWLVNQQLSYMLVPWICAHQVRLVPAVALGTAAVSLAAAAVSWRGYRGCNGAALPGSPDSAQPHRFVGLIGVATALLFALAILLQGSAGLVFHGCER